MKHIKRLSTNSSPYWLYLARRARTSNETGALELKEPVEANPDLLSTEDVLYKASDPSELYEKVMSVFKYLSGREKQVITLLSNGCTERQSAELLHVSRSTIKQCKNRARKKLIKLVTQNRTFGV